jgi:hypothetical protein
MYPDIIPVYISYSFLGQEKSMLNNHTVLDMVKEELRLNQIETPPTLFGVMKGEQIVKKLEEHGKYVLLLVDEFDDLFRVKESDNDQKLQEIYRTSKYTLGDLNWLGNQKTGRFAVLLCCSSPSCPWLITLEADREEFPLQNHAPHLNGTKYKTRRLPVSPFLDAEVSKQMLAHFLPNATQAQGKLITFCVGMNPRRYSLLATSIQDENDMFSAFHYGSYESGLTVSGTPELLFRDKLLKRMREKNTNMYEMIKDDINNTVNAQKVMYSDWISLFEPLTISEVKSVWLELNDNKELTVDLMKKMQKYLCFLSDKDQLSFYEINHDGLPPFIYPISGAQVFIYHDYNNHQYFVRSTNKILNEF